MPNDIDALAEMMAGYGILIAALVAAMERSDGNIRPDLTEILMEFVSHRTDMPEDSPEMLATHNLLRFLRSTRRGPSALVH